MDRRSDKDPMDPLHQPGFDGRVAVVSGAASGIGAAVVRALAARGTNVMLNYLSDEASAAKTCDDTRHLPGQVMRLQADVSKAADCRRIADAALDNWRRIDFVINNAAKRRVVPLEELDSLTEDDFLLLYRTNLVGAFQLARACAPGMREGGAGSVVNISSVAGRTGVGSSIAYSASKGALNTLTLSLARALAPDIRVNAICPGYVATERLKALGDARREQIEREQIQAIPLKRIGRPDDIADVVLFFCGSASRHITGEILTVDGGLSVR